MTSCSPFDIITKENLLSSKMLVTVKLHGVTSQKILNCKTINLFHDNLFKHLPSIFLVWHTLPVTKKAHTIHYNMRSKGMASFPSQKPRDLKQDILCTAWKGLIMKPKIRSSETKNTRFHIHNQVACWELTYLSWLPQ
jgi:hypothetical protein